MVRYDWTTCSKVIKTQVMTIQEELQQHLQSHFVGSYLHGSLAQGGFQPARSDINMVLVVDQHVTSEMKRDLISLCLRLSRMPCPLDVYILVQQDLHLFEVSAPFDLHYNERQREQLQQELRTGQWRTWNTYRQQSNQVVIDLMVLVQQGLCLAGHSIIDGFPPVSEQLFRAALIQHFQHTRQYRFEHLASYVLNACRTAAYIQDGTIRSKDDGGVWGLKYLPASCTPLIQQALALYREERLSRPVGRAVLNEFTATIEQMISQAETTS